MLVDDGNKAVLLLHVPIAYCVPGSRSRRLSNQQLVQREADALPPFVYPVIIVCWVHVRQLGSQAWHYAAVNELVVVDQVGLVGASPSLQNLLQEVPSELR